ncbi:hypothetical protein DFJ74DRAFT_237403 [Hyaloraphidium curvatum]|nr:hypothetical protein DFJ74DRAFT_237403 [Hyaloraphidium curvatum]
MTSKRTNDILKSLQSEPAGIQSLWARHGRRAPRRPGASPRGFRAGDALPLKHPMRSTCSLCTLTALYSELSELRLAPASLLLIFPSLLSLFAQRLWRRRDAGHVETNARCARPCCAARGVGGVAVVTLRVVSRACLGSTSTLTICDLCTAKEGDRGLGRHPQSRLPHPLRSAQPWGLPSDECRRRRSGAPRVASRGWGRR